MWITWDFKRLFWLPQKYWLSNPAVWFQVGSVLALGCACWKVLIFKFSAAFLLPRLSQMPALSLNYVGNHHLGTYDWVSTCWSSGRFKHLRPNCNLIIPTDFEYSLGCCSESSHEKKTIKARCERHVQEVKQLKSQKGVILDLEEGIWLVLSRRELFTRALYHRSVSQTAHPNNDESIRLAPPQ